MSPRESYALLWRGKPNVDLARLGAELAALREMYAPRVIEKRAGIHAHPRALERDRIAGQVARHFNVYLDSIRSDSTFGRIVDARHVLMHLLANDLKLSQTDIAHYLRCQQPAVSHGVNCARLRHRDTIALIRGKMAAGACS